MLVRYFSGWWNWFNVSLFRFGFTGKIWKCTFSSAALTFDLISFHGCRLLVHRVNRGVVIYVFCMWSVFCYKPLCKNYSVKAKSDRSAKIAVVLTQLSFNPKVKGSLTYIATVIIALLFANCWLRWVFSLHILFNTLSPMTYYGSSLFPMTVRMYHIDSDNINHIDMSYCFQKDNTIVY